MNRRRLVIGIIGFIVFAAVFSGVIWQSAPAEAITVRFHSFSTNGTQHLAFGVVSNATSKDFLVSVSTEYMTNEALQVKLPMFWQPYEAWGGREHGLVQDDVLTGSNRCRFVVQYRRTPTTHIGLFLEPFRARVFGPRPTAFSYSDEFHTPP